MKRSLLVLSLGLFACDPSSSGVPSPVVEAGSDAPVAACPKPTSGPTSHGGSVQTETWTAAASPHVLPYDTTIYGTLTIEPCAEVQLAGGSTITISATGKVIADGDSARPIHVGPSDPAKPFSRIRTSGGGTIHMSYVTIDGGGDPLNTTPDLAGTFDLQGLDQTKPSQATMFVDHVTIAGSKSNGIVLRDGAGFAPGSTDLTVTGAAQYPVSIWPRAVGTLPTGKFTGNTKDEILLGLEGSTNYNFAETTTMHDPGVPYHVGNEASAGDLRVDVLAGSMTPIVLTIDPGVVMRFKKGGRFTVQTFSGNSPALASLVAVGTPAKPIVFTSAEAAPAAGDWLGIWFGELPTATNKITYARVEYAGGTSTSGSSACNAPGTNDAAIRLFGLPAGGAFVTNTIIANSAGHGFDRGWRDDMKPDFMPTNTFTAIAGCKQSYPKDTNGGCPMPVPCP